MQGLLNKDCYICNNYFIPATGIRPNEQYYENKAQLIKCASCSITNCEDCWCLYSLCSDIAYWCSYCCSKFCHNCSKTNLLVNNINDVRCISCFNKLYTCRYCLSKMTDNNCQDCINITQQHASYLSLLPNEILNLISYFHMFNKNDSF